MQTKSPIVPDESETLGIHESTMRELVEYKSIEIHERDDNWSDILMTIEIEGISHFLASMCDKCMGSLVGHPSGRSKLCDIGKRVCLISSLLTKLSMYDFF